MMTPPQPEHAERLERVDPALRDFVLFAVRELGGRWSVSHGVRNDEEQGKAYARGRTTPGEPPFTKDRPLGTTVTEARYARETAHGMRRYGGCAVDLVAIHEDGKVDWAPARYLALGALAKSCGFEWGGDFKRRNPKTGKLEPFRDLGHVQVAGWRNIPAGPLTTV